MASPLGRVGAVSVRTAGDTKPDFNGNGNGDGNGNGNGDEGDGSAPSMTIRISEAAGIVSEGLSLSTWGAAYVLANSLHKLAVPGTTSPPLRCLELGAGTGLVGLAAAALWRADVTMTDLPVIVPGIAANVALNAGLLAQYGGAASCATLDWTEPTSLGPQAGQSSTAARLNLESNRPSVILAADTIYAEEHAPLLVATVLCWLARTAEARMVMCYPLRMAYIEHIRDFWTRMEEAGFECEAEGREDGVDEWNEVASTPFEWCIWRWRRDADGVL